MSDGGKGRRKEVSIRVWGYKVIYYSSFVRFLGFVGRGEY